MELNSTDTIQELYKSAGETRIGFDGNVDNARKYYAELANYVSRVSSILQPKEQRELLDVGCGCGWSSFVLAGAGFKTTGIDLNAEAFEPATSESLKFLQGSALSLPFESSSFDVVVSYQCVEHIPDPAVALSEMVRVCRPNGIVCIVGPNLLSPFMPFKLFAIELSRGQLALRRDAKTPIHPYGNTAIEHISKFFWTSWVLSRKLVNRQVSFNMRVPDAQPPFCGDNDACYLCTPTDIVRFFRSNNLRIIQNGRHGRPPLSYLFAGGTWVAAQKI